MAALSARQSLCAACLLAAAASACATSYPLPRAGEDLVGETTYVTSKPNDTLATLAFRQRQGFRQLLHANAELDPWKVPPGTRVRLPTQLLLPRIREGIVINVPEMRLYYFPRDSEEVFVYPVAVGRLDWKTPLGVTEVKDKVRNPIWYPPASIRREHAEKGDPLPPTVPPGPDNPLGHLAMRLGWSDILIHGTNMPLGGIGMPVTHGCLRLYPEDIEALFDQVEVGTKVTIIDEPYKFGRHQGRWYFEAHAMLSEDPHARGPRNPAPILRKMKARSSAASAIDWEAVAKVLHRSDGAPMPVDSLDQQKAAPRPSPVAYGQRKARSGAAASPPTTR